MLDSFLSPEAVSWHTRQLKMMRSWTAAFVLVATADATGPPPGCTVRAEPFGHYHHQKAGGNGWYDPGESYDTGTSYGVGSEFDRMPETLCWLIQPAGATQVATSCLTSHLPYQRSRICSGSSRAPGSELPICSTLCAFADPKHRASQVFLSFREYEVQSYFANFEIYDGKSTADPSLSATLPQPISSTSGSMLILWTSDNLRRYIRQLP